MNIENCKNMIMERLTYIYQKKDIISDYLDDEMTLKSIEYILLDDTPLISNKGYHYLNSLIKKSNEKGNIIKILKKVYEYVYNELFWNDIKPKKISVIENYIKIMAYIIEDQEYINGYFGYPIKDIEHFTLKNSVPKIKRDTLSDVTHNSFIVSLYDTISLYTLYNFFNSNELSQVRERLL